MDYEKRKLSSEMKSSCLGAIRKTLSKKRYLRNEIKG